MTILVASLSSAFVSLIVSVYFLYQWLKQRSKSLSTLDWALGFLFYSTGHALTAIVNSDLYQISQETKDLLLDIRGLFINLFFLLIFWGTVRLITRRKWLVYTLSFVAFLFACTVVFCRTRLFDNFQNYLTFKTYTVLLPASLIMTGIFLILYGVLVAEAAQKKKGITLVILSWFLYIILLLILPSAYSNYLDIWYSGRAFSTLFLLFGFIILEQESRQALQDLEEDKKHYHHFK